MKRKTHYLTKHLGIRIIILILAAYLTWIIGLKPLIVEKVMNKQYRADLSYNQVKNQGMNWMKSSTSPPSSMVHVSKALQDSDLIPLIVDQREGKDSSQTLLHIQLTGNFLPLWEFINQLEQSSIQVISADFNITKDKVRNSKRLVLDLIIRENA